MDVATIKDASFGTGWVNGPSHATLFCLSNHDAFSNVQRKAVRKLLDWENAICVCAHHGAKRTSRVEAFTQLLEQLQAKPTRTLRELNEIKIIKTKAGLYYLKWLIDLRVRALHTSLIQKLSGSAPVARLVMRIRASRIFATYQPMAPTHIA